VSRRDRAIRLREADTLARSRASLWRVWSTTRGGEVRQYRLVEAKTEEAALKRVTRSIAARPVLPSSEWRAIYQEVGLLRG